ncbi:MAG: SAM-dependent methyltransferase [Gammaproteobacteria bacterium]|nr:MAG: SAM-dependent methyltransferase [Gammaproteobacteria bacterium]
MTINNKITAKQARFNAQKIALSPFTFQAVQVAKKKGILKFLQEHQQGLETTQISQKLNISEYGITVLLESCLSIDVVELKDNKWFLSLTGFMFVKDEMTKVNLDYANDVCYQGLFNLEQSIDKRKPAGLEVFDKDKKYETIYPLLKNLPEPAKTSWFNFDHFYSDNSFAKILPIIIKNKAIKLLDVGGNTGKFIKKALEYDNASKVAMADLPQQIKTAQEGLLKNKKVKYYPLNVLDDFELDESYDVIFFSQFLDCFADEHIPIILEKFKKYLTKNGKIYILETFWDNQKYEEASFCIVNTSLYFTAMANGYSRMYKLTDFENFIKQANLKISNKIENIGFGHTLIELRKI